MRKLLFTTGTCFVASVAIVIALFAWSTDIRQQPGNFLRQYPPHPVAETASIRLSDDAYYLAGATAHTVYLAHRFAPLHVLQLTNNLTDTTHRALSLEGIAQQKHFRITVQVDSPYFYFTDGSIPFYYRGTIDSGIGSNVLPDSMYFGDAVPLSAGSFAMRALSRQLQEHVLGKRILSAARPILKYDLLQKQRDGIFCTDGLLRYNRDLNRLLYVYHYRNQYLVMDTTLMLDYRANTIDTFSVAQVAFDSVSSERSVRLSGPPVTVNKRFATSGKYLFIHSKVAARNESMKQFARGAVIDVYDLLTHTYAFSFYLPDYRGKPLKDFTVADGKLYALFDNAVKRYDLMARSFPPETLQPEHTKPVSQE